MTVTFHTLLGKTKEIEESKIIVRPTVYGVILDGHRILLLKVKTTGKWFLPGGGLEAGEDDKIALQREVLEETGITVEVGEKLQTTTHNFYHDPSDGAYEMHITFFRCTPTSTTLTDAALDFDDYEETHQPQWVEIDTLNLTDFDPILHNVITKVQTSI